LRRGRCDACRDIVSGRVIGHPTQITDISLEQLQWADEVFVCNSVYGIWPVRAYAALSWPVGPLTRKLQTIARALLDA
jgi:4-amino-4-deoxychorismate lyase